MNEDKINQRKRRNYFVKMETQEATNDNRWMNGWMDEWLVGWMTGMVRLVGCLVSWNRWEGTPRYIIYPQTGYYLFHFVLV